MLWNWNNIFPYTNIHELNLDYIMRGIKSLAEHVQEVVEELSTRGLPAGGTAGQVLTKVDGEDYNAAWTDVEDSRELWRPDVSSDGTLSWTRSSEESAPASVNIKGEQGAQGPQGIQGPQGVQGIQGPAGVGVPAGGTAGQVLAKVDGTDYNTTWVNQSGGGGGGGAAVGAGKLYEYAFPYVAAGGTVTIPSNTLSNGLLSEQTYGVLELFFKHRDTGASLQAFTPLSTKLYIASGSNMAVKLYAVNAANNTLTAIGTLNTAWGAQDWTFTYESGVSPYAAMSDSLYARWVVDDANRVREVLS